MSRPGIGAPGLGREPQAADGELAENLARQHRLALQHRLPVGEAGGELAREARLAPARGAPAQAVRVFELGLEVRPLPFALPEGVEQTREGRAAGAGLVSRPISCSTRRRSAARAPSRSGVRSGFAVARARVRAIVCWIRSGVSTSRARTASTSRSTAGRGAQRLFAQ